MEPTIYFFHQQLRNAVPPPPHESVTEPLQLTRHIIGSSRGQQKADQHGHGHVEPQASHPAEHSAWRSDRRSSKETPVSRRRPEESPIALEHAHGVTPSWMPAACSCGTAALRASALPAIAGSWVNVTLQVRESLALPERGLGRNPSRNHLIIRSNANNSAQNHGAGQKNHSQRHRRCPTLT